VGRLGRPENIYNDIPFIDRSFASRAPTLARFNVIIAARFESTAARDCIGL